MHPTIKKMMMGCGGGCECAEEWIARSAPNSGYAAITYGNGLFVAVGSGVVATSPDGVNWTARTCPPGDWSSIAHDGMGMFVAGRDTFGGNSTMTSPDGINWTLRSTSFAVRGIRFFNGYFYAVGPNNINRSTNGTSWTQVSSLNGGFKDISWNGSIFVAVSNGGTVSVASSPDGVTWTSRSGISTTWQVVVFGNGLFVAVGYGTTRVMTSPDGINWTGRSADANAWSGIVYAGGIFVAVAGSGTNRVMTSIDGINWVGSLAAEANSWRAITFAQKMLVAVSSDGTNDVMTSKCNC